MMMMAESSQSNLAVKEVICTQRNQQKFGQ